MAPIILFVYLVFMGFMLMIGYRNHAVADFRRGLIAKVSECATNDIHAGKAFMWRYRAFETVSYDRMMATFWLDLRVSNYWKDDSFLKP